MDPLLVKNVSPASKEVEPDVLVDKTAAPDELAVPSPFPVLRYTSAAAAAAKVRRSTPATRKQAIGTPRHKPGLSRSLDFFLVVLSLSLSESLLLLEAA